MSDHRVQEQLLSEDRIKEQSYLKGTQMVADALKAGRYCDLPQGRLVLARAFNAAEEHLTTVLESKTAGLFGKYKGMLRRVPVNIAVVIALRRVLNACADPEGTGKMQAVLSDIGRAIELEAMMASIAEAGQNGVLYLERTLEYLDGGRTLNLNHRYRSLLRAAETTIGGWEHWSGAERDGCAKLILNSLWETGLFSWEQENGKRYGEYYLKASPELMQHFQDIRDEARPVIEFEPMIVPPEPWTGFGAGGYLTPWMRAHAPMMSLHHIPKDERAWVVGNLRNADIAKAALNKAQGTAYRVNAKVLDTFLQALGHPEQRMGLPRHGEAERPVFPMGAAWDKAHATESEMETFRLWKSQVAAWYADTIKQRSKKRALARCASLLSRFKNTPELYFVAYLDYRGRLYFRGELTPQSSDAVKGCLEFAHGEPLGEDGLFWLKVHVSGCAGYDKHDFHLRAAWVDEHWDELQAWAADPLSTDAPDPDSSFCLLAAVLALKEALALPDPRTYICHLPVAQDATCSGLQHFSAMFRDPVGAQFTNLSDPGGEQKQDIYMHVAAQAQAAMQFPDAVCQNFWSDKPITRGMAKRPVNDGGCKTM